MKSLSRKISRTSKSVLLFSFLLFYPEIRAQSLISSDRYLIRILDRTVSVQDISFQLRNLKALDCIYGNPIVTQYFEKSFIRELEGFLQNLPKQDEDVRRYLHGQEPLLKKLRFFFKMLRYSEDQKPAVSSELAKLIRESSHENKCGTAVLYQDTLKTNFKTLLEMELYLRLRYGAQLKSGSASFDSIRPAIDLFVESLDKQFGHEYFW